MLEIYNESLRDLLVRKEIAAKLDILNTQASGCNVPNATKVGCLLGQCCRVWRASLTRMAGSCPEPHAAALAHLLLCSLLMSASSKHQASPAACTLFIFHP